MSFESSRTQQVRRNAIDAENEFETAWRHANSILQDVSQSYPGYNDIWMLHFYGWYRQRAEQPDTQLDATIAQYAQAMAELEDRTGLPEELHPHTEDEHREPVSRGIRGRVLKWIISVERGSGLEGDAQKR